MDIKSLIISSININQLDQPRFSSDGKFLVPFNVNLDEIILQNELIINTLADKIHKFNFDNFYPVIYVNDDFSNKVYQKLIENYTLNNGKNWKKSYDLTKNRYLDQIIFIEPCLSCIDKYWDENEESTFIFEKKGLIPDVKENSYPNVAIFTLYSDSFVVIPNVEVSPLVDLNDLSNKLKNQSFFGWVDDPKQWTLLWINNNVDLFKEIIQGNDYNKRLFIDNYKKPLEKLGIIKEMEYNFQ
jgi:hypothetical protein